MTDNVMIDPPPPYLRWDELQGRVPLVLSMWDGETWHYYRPHPEDDGKLLRVEIEDEDADELPYLAKSPALMDDIHLRFIDFMYQRAYFPQIARFVDGIIDDARNLGASLAKIDHFFEHRASIGSFVNRFVETELEYMVGLCRSLLDLLHEIVVRVWDGTELNEGRRKCKLPKLSSMMLQSDRPRTADEIDGKWSIGPALAHFYAHNAPFFRHLRTYRDNIMHRGHAAPRVMLAPRGFAIERSVEPFSTLGVWTDKHHWNETYASLRPALAALVSNTLTACETFVMALERTVLLPPPVAPEYRVYFRSPHGRQLNDVKHVRDHIPWWLPADEASPPISSSDA